MFDIQSLLNNPLPVKINKLNNEKTTLLELRKKNVDTIKVEAFMKISILCKSFYFCSKQNLFCSFILAKFVYLKA